MSDINNEVLKLQQMIHRLKQIKGIASLSLISLIIPSNADLSSIKNVRF